ncbi:hypothetical protein CFC21_079228 [Triticum aestivum]|uniref:DUF4220 domain-containing protein n=2 Tax=Triticum aestivum TaxID=4565 RepID=A0A3B6MWM8_WHEAT|nr:uncharacterized protein LOC123120881 [Triticum aestivum]KAF7074344.1 hypothetical protein CFC21_079228 [Triticum aestivum]
MGISGAVEWWEEWQLRILVLASLLVQWLLFPSAAMRKFAIPSWFRSIIWLAYQGSDALAVYALANLFSRQRRQDCTSGQGNSILEVVWAPVLLVHLGGQDIISAYNIEDNELWTRHVLVAVSQITVAIYVFCKSWPGGDKRLLQAAIMFFIPGVLKCLEKPVVLKNASINSLVSSSEPPPTETYQFTLDDGRISGDINILENYVQVVGKYFRENPDPDKQGNITHPSHLFVDLASSYGDRFDVLSLFMPLDGEEAYDLLQGGLSNMFNLFYTKETLSTPSSGHMRHPWQLYWGLLLRYTCLYLPWAAIGLFHNCHREAYNDYDVKVTYALFCCTAVLETYSMGTKMSLTDSFLSKFGDIPAVVRLFPVLTKKRRSQFRVSQYSLIGFFARKRRHSMKMCILSLLQCKDLLDHRWCMKPCYSSVAITKLVLEYAKKGWEDEISDVDSYWKFNDNRGQWTLQGKCEQDLIWSLRGPFDKTVILWHIATDFCFYTSVDHQCAPIQCNEGIAPGQGHGCAARCGISPYHERAVRCREMSSYMMHLLFINPEMLLPGTRRNLFMSANAELENILMNDKPSVEAILKGDKPSLQDILRGNKSLIQFLKGKKPSHKEIKRGLVEIIITKMKTREVPSDVEENPAEEGFINDAWKISEALSALGDENKMWEVIEGVWVEMLCFSASRCRGYLHAKSLGTGGELLTYVWLLLSHMGMETLPERMQRTEFSSDGGNG